MDNDMDDDDENDDGRDEGRAPDHGDDESSDSDGDTPNAVAGDRKAHGICPGLVDDFGLDPENQNPFKATERKESDKKTSIIAQLITMFDVYIVGAFVPPVKVTQTVPAKTDRASQELDTVSQLFSDSIARRAARKTDVPDEHARWSLNRPIGAKYSRKQKSDASANIHRQAINITAALHTEYVTYGSIRNGARAHGALHFTGAYILGGLYDIPTKWANLILRAFVAAPENSFVKPVMPLHMYTPVHVAAFVGRARLIEAAVQAAEDLGNMAAVADMRLVNIAMRDVAPAPVYAPALVGASPAPVQQPDLTIMALRESEIARMLSQRELEKSRAEAVLLAAQIAALVAAAAAVVPVMPAAPVVPVVPVAPVAPVAPVVIAKVKQTGKAHNRSAVVRAAPAAPAATAAPTAPAAPVAQVVRTHKEPNRLPASTVLRAGLHVWVPRSHWPTTIEFNEGEVHVKIDRGVLQKVHDIGRSAGNWKVAYFSIFRERSKDIDVEKMSCTVAWSLKVCDLVDMLVEPISQAEYHSELIAFDRSGNV